MPAASLGKSKLPGTAKSLVGECVEPCWDDVSTWGLFCIVDVLESR